MIMPVIVAMDICPTKAIANTVQNVENENYKILNNLINYERDQQLCQT